MGGALLFRALPGAIRCRVSDSLLPGDSIRVSDSPRADESYLSDERVLGDELVLGERLLIDFIDILPAHQTPRESAVAEWASRFPEAGKPDPIEVEKGQITNASMAVEISRLLDLIPGDVVPAGPGKSQPDDLAHDAYFRVRRVEGEAPAVFARMALSARLVLLQEVLESPVALSASAVADMDRALADLLSCLFGGVVGDGPTVNAWRSVASRDDVMPRWIRGHQIFAALTQGLLLSFQAMGRAIRAGQTSEINRWADLTASLLRGSGAAFMLTADFPVEQYNSVVRPSMMPPAAPICLSGLMSIDHRLLVQVMRDLKPALKSLHEHDPARHEKIHAELTTVYDRHILVCARFVGKRPSLLTAGSTEKSGPQLVEQFKQLRLKPFESQPHATRLKSDPAAPFGSGCPHSKKLSTVQPPTGKPAAGADSET